MSIALEIQRQSRATLAGQGPGRIEALRVAVGELCAVDPDLLVFAWEALTAGGPDAGARLEIDWRPSRQTCVECGEVKERAAGSWLRLCPACGSPLRVEGGTELDLMEITFDPFDEAGGPVQ